MSLPGSSASGAWSLNNTKPAPVDWCGLRKEWLAAVYSPTNERLQYHRRYRA